MRITVNIDEKLIARAVELTGLNDETSLVCESLKALIEKESAKQLSALGGSDPFLADISRRQSNSR